MPAFLPLDFAPNAAPVDPQAGKMSPLTQAYSLEGVSQMIFAALPPKVASRDHAIPNIGAYIEYLTDAVLHGKNSDPYVTRWRGVLAMVGMSELYNFGIRIVAKNMSAPATPVGLVYKQELARLGLLQDNFYYLVMRGNHALAILHPQILLCPFKTIEAEALAGVPWFDAASSTWQEIAGGSTLTQPEQLQLAAWLEAQRNSVAVAVPPMSQVLQLWEQELSGGYSIPSVSAPTPLPNEMRQTTFGAISAATFANVPNYKVNITADIFTEDVLFTHAKSLSTTTAWSPALSDDSGTACPVLPPITAEFAEMLTKSWQNPDELTGRPDLELLSVQVSHDAFAAKREITVTVQVRNGTLTMRRSKKYFGRQLVYVSGFPYFSVWPYVNLAPGQWKDYTVSMVPRTDLEVPPSNCAAIDAGQQGFAFQGDTNNITRIRPQDKPSYEYYIRKTEEFPLFVPLQYNNDLGETRQAGCLVVRPEGVQVIATPATANAAIDFGTSNSVCAVSCNSVVHKILNGERVKGLVAFDSSSDVEIENFHRYYGTSTHSKPYKFPSVAQLYSNMGTEPLKNGQILLTEGGIIDYFAGTSTNLTSIGIYSYLKSDVKSILANVNTAEELFVKHLALLCALEAKCQGAGSINYYFSYPNESYKRTLQVFWNSAMSYIAGMGIFQALSQGDMTECDASAYFVQNLPNAATAAGAAPGFAVVDIGGGTSDMTVWRDPNCGENPLKLGSLSFQYAGNQLFSRTFFSYFKKNMNVFATIFPKIFNTAKLSGVAKQRATSAVNNYMNSLKNIGDVNDVGFPALTALLNTLFEEPGIDQAYWAGVPCRELRNIIYFKLKSIMYVLGYLVRECNGINAPQGTFQIFLVGGGSQAYRMTGSTMFDQGAFDLLSKLTDPKAMFAIQPPANGNKTEVVDGTLTYKTNPANNSRRPEVKQAVKPSQPITVENLRQAYRIFIEVTVKQDPELVDLLPMLEIGERPGEGTPEQNALNGKYMAVFAKVWANVNKNLDRDTSELIRLAAFSVRVAEEMLS